MASITIPIRISQAPSYITRIITILSYCVKCSDGPKGPLAAQHEQLISAGVEFVQAEMPLRQLSKVNIDGASVG